MCVFPGTCPQLLWSSGSGSLGCWEVWHFSASLARSSCLFCMTEMILEPPPQLMLHFSLHALLLKDLSTNIVFTNAWNPVQFVPRISGWVRRGLTASSTLCFYSPPGFKYAWNFPCTHLSFTSCTSPSALHWIKLWSTFVLLHSEFTKASCVLPLLLTTIWYIPAQSEEARDVSVIQITIPASCKRNAACRKCLAFLLLQWTCHNWRETEEVRGSPGPEVCLWRTIRRFSGSGPHCHGAGTEEWQGDPRKDNSDINFCSWTGDSACQAGD